MRTDADILIEIDAAFGACMRPEHFCNHTHCAECKSHDDLLRSRDRASLTLADLGNPGASPMTGCSAAGFAYFMPALARIVLSDSDPAWGWYGGDFVSLLWTAGPTHRYQESFSDVQRRAIASLLLHLIDTRAAELVGFEEDYILDAYEIWSGQAQRPGTVFEKPVV